MNHTACFTGKRPQHLPWGYNEEDERCIALKQKIRHSIQKAIRDGYAHFISGMALGVDMWAALIVLDLKQEHPHITLEAAVPCFSQSQKWNIVTRKQYQEILSSCDKVTYISKAYTPYCMMQRNMYMIEHSSRLIAVYDNSGGGSGNTLRYAQRRNLEIEVIW